MKVKNDITGFTLESTDKNLIISMPISNIIKGFNNSPYNWDGRKIKRGGRYEFVKWLIENLQDDADSETGDNFIVTMLDSVFERLFEDYQEWLNIPEEK